jgi:hypothetical protein
MISRLSFLLLVTLLSCTKDIYHVSSLQSEQVTVQGHDYVYENDHLRVVYNFWDKGGRMRFLLYNKTSKPLYIDWEASHLIRNSNTIQYSQLPPLPQNTRVDPVLYTDRDLTQSPYLMTARGSQLAEIPSETYVAIADFPIEQLVINRKTKQRVFDYTRENSPLRIGQQLVYALDKDRTNTFHIDHSFWVDKIQVMATGELVKLFGSPKQGQPNALYVIERRPAPVATVVVTLTLLTGAGLLLHTMMQDMFSGITLCC